MDLDLTNARQLWVGDCGGCGLTMRVPMARFTSAELKVLASLDDTVFVPRETLLEESVLEGADPVYFVTCPECERRSVVAIGSTPIENAPGPPPARGENTPLAPPLADEETA